MSARRKAQAQDSRLLAEDVSERPSERFCRPDGRAAAMRNEIRQSGGWAVSEAMRLAIESMRKSASSRLSRWSTRRDASSFQRVIFSFSKTRWKRNASLENDRRSIYVDCRTPCCDNASMRSASGQRRRLPMPFAQAAPAIVGFPTPRALPAMGLCESFGSLRKPESERSGPRRAGSRSEARRKSAAGWRLCDITELERGRRED